MRNKSKEYIAIIPARRDSKRIKNKNVIIVKGKKLIDYTLLAAKKSKRISKTIISTNIRSIIKKDKKDVFYSSRPEYLCKDDTNTESVIKYTINNYKNLFQNNKKEFFFVLLQPTSPLRNSKDIDSAIRHFEKEKYDSLFSSFKKKFLIWSKKKGSLKPINYSMKKRIRGQFIKDVLVENGAIFIFGLNGFKKFNNRLFGKIGTHVMSQRNSLEIDEKYDLKLLKLISG